MIAIRIEEKQFTLKGRLTKVKHLIYNNIYTIERGKYKDKDKEDKDNER